jgi:hypothetical protein
MQTTVSLSVRWHALCAAFLMCTGTLSASAQTAPAAADDFSALSRLRTVAVVDDTGQETTGRLVRVTSESLTMKVEGRERVFDRAHITTVHEVGDSLTNGMIVGLLAGGALGVAYASFSDCYKDSRVCTASENARNRAIGGALFGAIGLGIGAVIDKRHERRTLRYTRPVASRAPTVSLAPSLGVTGARLLVTAAW